MNEVEYLRATNRVKVSAALNILSDVIADELYGISRNDLSEITSRLSVAQDNLFESYRVTDEENKNAEEHF